MRPCNTYTHVFNIILYKMKTRIRMQFTSRFNHQNQRLDSILMLHASILSSNGSCWLSSGLAGLWNYLGMQDQHGIKGKINLECMLKWEIHSHYWKSNVLPRTEHFKIFLENTKIAISFDYVLKQTHKKCTNTFKNVPICTCCISSNLSQRLPCYCQNWYILVFKSTFLCCFAPSLLEMDGNNWNLYYSWQTNLTQKGAIKDIFMCLMLITLTNMKC